MKEHKYTIDYKVLSYDNLSEIEQKLCKEAQKISEKAYAPYSKFRVGASILLENGEILSGSNQENSAFPSGTCAERNVLFYAGAKYPDQKPLALFLVAHNGIDYVDEISPCGACRQVIMETSKRFAPFKIYLAGKEKIIVLEDSRLLLPFGFDGRDIKN